MPIIFNTVLEEARIALSEVRLLRHKDQRASRGRSLYELWRDARQQFELYQSTQKIEDRARLPAPYWASFLGTPRNETMFAGLYHVNYLGLLEQDTPAPHMDEVWKAGSSDVYDVTLAQPLGDLVGRLFIDWGPAFRVWIQKADQQEKQITELRTKFEEPDFPGFLNFIKPLSELNTLPITWVVALRSSGGIYLLTCPKTREQYVGKADGGGGFWNRWQDYVRTGHGDNIALKSRDPSDYQVSILEVAGTSSTPDDILRMEILWKLKLQSREMGLNRN
jgi:hypothetical protein